MPVTSYHSTPLTSRKIAYLIYSAPETCNHPPLNVSRGSDIIANHRLLNTSLAYAKKKVWRHTDPFITIVTSWRPTRMTQSTAAGNLAGSFFAHNWTLAQVKVTSLSVWRPSDCWCHASIITDSPRKERWEIATWQPCSTADISLSEKREREDSKKISDFYQSTSLSYVCRLFLWSCISSKC